VFPRRPKRQLDFDNHPLIAAVGRGMHESDETAIGSSTLSNAKSADAKELLKLLKDRTRPVTLITLTGYLGQGKDTAWVRLYTDETLNHFYILRKADIVRREQRDQDDAADGKIDVIWLSRDAEIARGRRQPRPEPEEARFIDGGFLPAGDVSGSLNAGTRRSLFGDANSPACCRWSTSSYPR
jgi:hypothetical protein